MDRFSHAEWIFVDGVTTPVVDRYFEYRATLTAPRSKATLFISAHLQYAVYVNGTFVDWGQYADYEHYQVYDELCLDPYLHEGDNELLVRQYVCGTDFSTHGALIPGVIFAAWDGEDELLYSNPTILSRPDVRYLENGELLTPQLGYNFEYDATLPEAAFAPSTLAGKQKSLYPRPIKKQIVSPETDGTIVARGMFLETDPTLPKSKRMQSAFLSARRHEELCKGETFTWDLADDCRADGVYFVADMGGEVNGLLTFSVDVPETTEILIGFGEHLDDLRVRAAVGSRNFCFRYVAKAGHNEFFHPFQRLGLRYIQLHIYSRSGTLNRVGVRKTDYPLAYLPIPVTDKLHRRIWEVGRKTLELCMHEHYEDCPWREQSLYAMDSRVQILCGYYAFGETAFPRAALSLMHHSLRPDGLLELCPPGKVGVNIPSFTAVYVREVWEYTHFTGDQTLAGEVFGTLKAIADGFIARIDETGLLPLYTGDWAWNFYEWQPGLSGIGHYTDKAYDSLLSTFVSDALRCFGEICRLLQPEEADRYFAAARELAASVHKHFYDAASGGYLTRKEDGKPLHALTQAMMLFADVVPEELTAGVEEWLMSDALIPCSISMTIYAYEALLKRSDAHRDYVLSHIEKVWGRMLDCGADTFWETVLGADDFEMAGSLCHGWSAVPIYIFSHYHLP